MLPPLSDGLTTISVRFWRDLSACICPLLRVRGIFGRVSFLKSVMDWCKKAQMAGQVNRSGNCPEFNLNLLMG